MRSLRYPTSRQSLYCVCLLVKVQGTSWGPRQIAKIVTIWDAKLYKTCGKSTITSHRELFHIQNVSMGKCVSIYFQVIISCWKTVCWSQAFLDLSKDNGLDYHLSGLEISKLNWIARGYHFLLSFVDLMSTSMEMESIECSCKPNPYVTLCMRAIVCIE